MTSWQDEIAYLAQTDKDFRAGATRVYCAIEQKTLVGYILVERNDEIPSQGCFYGHYCNLEIRATIEKVAEMRQAFSPDVAGFKIPYTFLEIKITKARTQPEVLDELKAELARYLFPVKAQEAERDQERTLVSV